MLSPWQVLCEALDDDDDLASLHARALGKTQPTKFPAPARAEFEPDDDVAAAMKDAGLNPTSSKTQQHKDSVAYTKNWMRAMRYADQVLTIDDRKEMAELVQTFAAGMQHKRPLSPQLLGRYVGQLLLAHDENHAKQVLMNLSQELMGEKR